jgi:hypothetical protein
VKHKGLYQLVCAATVDSEFCNALLRDPVQAISSGYLGQPFGLTAEEHDLVLSIQARALEDLTAQIDRWLSTNGNGNGNGFRILAEEPVELFRYS